MTSQYRHRRTSNPATAFPSPIEPGEITVNTANRQIAVGDAASGSIGTPLSLIAVRYFDVRAIYPVGELVVNAGVIYRAQNPTGPGAFNAPDWLAISGALDVRYVQRAGDTMLGALVLDGDPVNPLEASTKQYVDAQVRVKSSVIASDTPPTGVPDNTIWFESDTGLLFINYNDGNSTQWVIACPQPDLTVFVERAGDTMLGPLTLAADPTANLQSATKQYVDNKVASKSSVLVADTPPSGSPDNTLWWESDSGTLFINYNDGNSSQFVAIAGGGADAVLYATVQSLLASQQQQARSNIYAAPFDALAYNGMQWNGSIEISQENGGAAVSGITGVARYIVDGYSVACSGPVVLTAQQVADAPPGYINSLKVSVTTIDTTMAATSYARLYHPIEGYRTARLAFGTGSAQPVSVGFWAKANRPGSYSGSIRNSAANRSYPFTFTVNSSLTWEYKTVTIPGDLTGTWAVNNTTGLFFTVSMAAGVNCQAPANLWGPGDITAVTGTINGVAATTDIFQVTGLVVLPGIELPSASRAPFIARPYDQELQLCRRYFYNGVPPTKGVVNGAGNGTNRNSARHPVLMRAVPALAMTSPLPIYDGANAVTVTSIATNYSTVETLEFETTTGAMAAGRIAIVYQGAGGNLNVDARL
jgi:hypothetical protein